MTSRWQKFYHLLVNIDHVFAVILFLGACMRPPRLSMVTEYMEMGSLYYLIQLNSSQNKKLSWRKRLKMLRDICRFIQSARILKYSLPVFEKVVFSCLAIMFLCSVGNPRNRYFSHGPPSYGVYG